MKNNLIEQLHSSIKGKHHIIWDWNGTLLNDVDHAISVMNTLLKEHELPELNRGLYRKIFDFPVIKYYEALGFDFEKESFTNLCHKFVDRFMAGFREQPLFPEMKSVLMQLQEEGLAQSVLSATDQPNLNSMVDHFELQGFFKFVFGIDNKFAASKVERGHELIRLAGFPKERTVIIGDTLHDVDVANALGIEAVLISHGHQCPTRLRQHHSLVIEV
jgi:phosphoglycolate phosphatase